MSSTWSGLAASVLLALLCTAGARSVAEPILGRAAADGELSVLSQPGDHLSGIARRMLQGGDSVDNLRLLVRMNALRQPNVLAVGTPIRLPRERLRYDAVKATVERADGASRADGSALAAGQTVQAGDSLATGANGGVLLRLANGTTVLIRADSQVRLERLRNAIDFDQSDSALALTRGAVEAQVNKARGGTRFEIRSPVATLGVRGTSFRAALGEAGESRVEVLTGLVGTTGNADAKAVDVSAGFGVVVDGTGRTGELVALPPAPDLSALPARLEQIDVRFQMPVMPAVAGFRGELIEPATQRLVATARAVAGQLAFQDIPDGAYDLVVRAVTAQGLEGLGATHALLLRARPQAPLPLAPKAAAQLWGGSAALSWAAAPPAQRYRAQVFGSTPAEAAARAEVGSALPAFDQVIATTAVAPSLPPGNYLWRVASIDADGRQGPFGQLRAFTLQPTPPALAPPAMGDNAIELSWIAVPGASYDTQLARDANFEQLVLERRVATPSLSFERPAPGRLHVRVRPVLPNAEPGPWSPAQIIDLPAPPPTPAPVWPWLLLLPLLWLL